MARLKPILPFDHLPPIDPESEDINVFVETPRGSRNKFKYEPSVGCFLLHKVLPGGAVFPYDFGYIPGTAADDGDPLDVLLLLDVPVFAGCLVRARLIGVLEAEQKEDGEKDRNDRLIGVAARSKDQENTRSLKDISPHLLSEIEKFFVDYNEAEGRIFKPLGFRSSKTATKLLRKAIKRAGKGNKS